MSQNEMQILAEKDLLPEMKKVHLDKCVDCMAGKQNRTAFRLSPPIWRKTALELIHTDVCYVDMTSNSRGQYFVTVIDDYSRKLWVSMLKTKDQVLSIFKEFQARVERETN